MYMHRVHIVDAATANDTMTPDNDSYVSPAYWSYSHKNNNRKYKANGFPNVRPPDLNNIASVLKTYL